MTASLVALQNALSSSSSAIHDYYSQSNSLLRAEWSRFGQYVASRSETATLRQLFYQAIEATANLFGRSANERTAFVATNSSHSSISSRLLAQQIPELAPSERLTEPLPPYLDPIELRRLSLLHRQGDEQALSYDSSLFDLLTGSTSMAKEPFLRLLRYLPSFLAQQNGTSLAKEELFDSFASAFDRQSSWQLRLRQLVSQGNETAQAELLAQEASSLALQVASLPVGSSFFHKGELGKSTPLPPLATSLLKKQLPERFHGLLSAGPAALASALKEHLHGDWKEQLLNEEQEELLRTIASSIQGRLEAARAQVEGSLPASWYTALAASVKQDLRELATGRAESVADQELTRAERVWEALATQGFEKAIEDALDQLLETSVEALTEGVDQLKSTLQQGLPKPLTELLDTMGLSLSASTPFWLEVKHTESQQYTVRLFCLSDRGGDLHPTAVRGETTGCQLPLVFSQVPIERLSKQFFVRMLSYEAWPKWELGVTYSLADLREECTLLLGQEADGDSFLPDELAIGGSALENWMAYAYHLQGLPSSQFRKLYRYQLPLDGLCRSWPRLVADPAQLRDPSIRATLQRLCERLSEEAVTLQKGGLLSDQELTACHATLWEVRAELKEQEPPQRAAGIESTLVLPPELYQLLEQLFVENELSKEHLETIKDFFVAIVGEEGGSTFDFIVDSFLPKEDSARVRLPNERERARSWRSFFQIEPLCSYLQQLSTMRLSLLHLYRALVPLIVRFIALVQWVVRLSLLTNLIGEMVPQLPRGVAFLIALFGPSAAERLVPQPLMELIQNSYRLYRSCVDYLKQRIALLILSSLAHRLVSEEEIIRFHSTIQTFQQRMNRQGTLSFDLSPPTHPIEPIELPPPLLAAPSRSLPLRPESIALPRPTRTELTIDNLASTLDLWNEQAQQLWSHNPLWCQVFLCEQIRSLPLPSRPPELGLWEQGVNPQDILERLHPLLLLLYNARFSDQQAGKRWPNYRAAEVICAQYTLLAIFDRLVRRCEEATPTEGYSYNGFFEPHWSVKSLFFYWAPLAEWMSSPTFRLIHPQTSRRLKEIADYLGFTPFHGYSKTELKQPLRRNFLVDVDNYSAGGGGILCNTYRYHEHMIWQKSFFSKAILYGYPKDHWGSTRLCFFYSDPSADQILESLANDPSEAAAERRRKIEALKAEDHPMDSRHGLLPRHIYFLRLANFVAQGIMKKGPATIKELSFPPPTKESNGLWFFAVPDDYRRLWQRLEEASGPWEEGYLPLLSESFSQLLTEPKKRLNSHSPESYDDKLAHYTALQTFLLFDIVTMRSRSPSKIASQKRVEALIEEVKREGMEIPDILRDCVLKKSQLLSSSKEIKKLLTLEEEALLEIAIKGAPSGRLVRLLSFFTHARGRLEDHEFFCFFKLLISDLQSLELQLEERPPILADIARYFLELLDYCAAEQELHSVLPQVARIYSEMLGHGRSYTKEADYHREKLRSWLRSQLATTQQHYSLWNSHGHCQGYLTLLWTYLSLDPSELPEPIRRRALLDIGRVRYAKYDLLKEFSTEEQLVAQELFYLWEPELERAIKEEAELRNELLDSLFADIGFVASSSATHWEGSFPLYQKGAYLIDLLHPPATDHFRIPTAAEASVYPLQKQLNRSVNGHHIVYKKLEGQLFRRLSAQEMAQLRLPVAEGESLWICAEQNNGEQLILRKTVEGEISMRYRMIEDEAAPSATTYLIETIEERHEGNFVQKYPLDELDHQLHLLSWFQPLSSIQLVLEPARGQASAREPTRRLLFSQLPLTFELRERQGSWHAIALDGRASGFCIALRQYEPSLLRYGRYLLLENGQGEKLVQLLSQSSLQLWSQFFAKKFAHITLTPYLQHILGTAPIKEEELFTYSIQQEGALDSTEPRAIAYLLLFHYLHGDREKARSYWLRLRDLSVAMPPTEQSFQQLELLLLPLMLDGTKQAAQLLLEIAAWRQEQLLLQELPKPKACSLQSVLWMAATQQKYAAYLQTLERGEPPYLSHYQELFLLKSLAIFHEALFAEQLTPRLDPQLQALLEKIGIRGLAEQLFLLPAIAERYRQLQEEHEEGSRWQRTAELLLLESLFSGETVPQIDMEAWVQGKLQSYFASPPSQGKVVQRRSLFSKALSVYKLGREQLAKKEASLGWERWLLEPPSEPLPIELEELTPKKLVRYFLPLYSLLFDIGPLAEQKEQAELLRQHLPLLRGHFSDASASYLLSCLQQLAEQGRHAGSPSPEELKELAKLCHQYERLMKEKKQLMLALKQRQGRSEEPDEGEEWLTIESAIESKKAALLQLRRHPLLQENKPQEVLQKRIAEIQSHSLVHKGISLLTGAVSQSAGNSLLPYGTQWLQAAFKQTLLGITGVSSLYTVQGLLNIGLTSWHAVRKLQLHRDAVALRRQQRLESSRLPTGLLPEATREALIQRERAIDAVMEQLLSSYFDVEQLAIIEQREAMPLPLWDGDPATLQTAWAELQAELQAYYERPEQPTFRYSLKSDKSISQLHLDLTLLRSSVDQKLREQRDYIVKYANHAFPIEGAAEERKQLISQLQALTDKKPLTFEEIDTAFAQSRDELLTHHNSSLRPEELLHLKERLYLYHLMASRWPLLFGQLQRGISSERDCFKVASELQRRRTWGFDLPAALVLAKLLFESKSGLLLWKRQSRQLDHLLSSPYHRVVVELIMGSGKSSCMLPIMGKVMADGAHLVIKVHPAAVAKDAMALASRLGRKLFDQSSFTFKSDRSMSWSRDQLWALSKVLERALYEREEINLIKEQLQTLELCFIERALDLQGRFSRDQGAWKEELELFRRCLRLINSHGLAIIDETHIQFCSKVQLNHPLGAIKKLKDRYVATTEKVLLKLFSLPSLQPLLTVKTAKPAPLDEAVYERELLPRLAKAMASQFDIEEIEEAELAAYLAGQAKEIPACVLKSPQRSEIALAKGLITLVLKKALAKTIHVDFASATKQGEEFARPSIGNVNPQEHSTIRNPFEALVKSALLLLHNRLSESQCEKLLEELRTAGRKEAHTSGCRLSETASARFFRAHCPAFELFTLSSPQKEELYRQVNASDPLVLTYLRRFVAKEISFFSSNLSSNSSNFGSLFANFFSTTGTPYNIGSYPLKTELLRDPGTDGETIELLLQMGHRPGAIQLLEQSSPWKVLEEIIESCLEQQPDIRALIDRGALFNGLSSYQVAKRLLRYIEERRPDLDGVAFYLDGQLMMWEKGSATAHPIGQSSIPKERRFSYFAQPQTYAADNPQKAGAIALLSVGEETTFDELAQALWRMRGLKTEGQQVYFVMTKEVRGRICQETSLPTIEQIMVFTKANSKKKLKIEDYNADRDKLHDILRTAFRKKALSDSPIDEAIGLLRTFSHLFLTSVEEDPFFLFGMIDAKLPPKELFTALKNVYLQLLEAEAALFSPEERKELRAQIESIGDGSYPEEIHVYQKEGRPAIEKLDDLDQAMELHQDQEAEREEEEEEEQQVELQQEIELEQLQQPSTRRPPLQTFFPWSHKLQPQRIDSWLQISSVPEVDRLSDSLLSKAFSYIQLLREGYKLLEGGAPPLFRLRDVLISLPQEEAALVGKLWSSTLLISNNLSYLIGPDSNRFIPFGPNQIPLQELLIICRQGERPWLLLLDPEETSYWRKKLAEERSVSSSEGEAEVKLGLYDIGTSILLAQGRGDLSNEVEDPLFARCIVQLKFLRADVHYSPVQSRLLLPWLKKNYKPLMSFFHQMHRLHGKNLFVGSSLDRLCAQIELLMAT